MLNKCAIARLFLCFALIASASLVGSNHTSLVGGSLVSLPSNSCAKPLAVAKALNLVHHTWYVSSLPLEVGNTILLLSNMLMIFSTYLLHDSTLGHDQLTQFHHISPVLLYFEVC